MARTRICNAWTRGTVCGDRFVTAVSAQSAVIPRRFLPVVGAPLWSRPCRRTRVLGVLSLLVAGLTSRGLVGVEPPAPPDLGVPIPDAQVGSLYPLLKATAGRSTMSLSFLQERFQDVAAWKGEAQPKVLSLLSTRSVPSTRKQACRSDSRASPMTAPTNSTPRCRSKRSLG